MRIAGCTKAFSQLTRRRIGYNYASMRRIFLIALILITILTLTIPESNVSASIIAAGEMIDLVNTLRVNYGLSSLIVDPILNSTAYATAEIMAANAVCAHIGGASERIAAAGFGGGATIYATENMACATSANIDWLQSVWADYDHMLPMTDPKYTHVGAGTYTGSNGVTYYVLHAAYIAGAAGTPVYITPESTVPGPYVEPVITATPLEDGTIVHIVRYGQALSTIATWYGVSMEQIMALNGMTTTSIFVDQRLLIRLAPTITATPTRTPTMRRPTRTPTLTPIPRTATPTRTITPTPTKSLLDSLPKIDRQWAGLGLLIISAIGLALLLFFSFIRPKFKK